MAEEDPFNFVSESSPDDECFQAWSANKTVVANLTPCPYNPVVETVKKEVLKVKKSYPSPKQKSTGKKKSFMERMREKNSNQPRLVTELGASSKSKPKDISNRDKGNPFGNLKCSPAMKKFILSEFNREKLSFNFLPEKQVAMAVIHRYKSYIASSGVKFKEDNPKIIRKVTKSAKIGGNKLKTKKTSKKGTLVEDSCSLEVSGDEQFEIQEFDENDLPIPSEGSFSLNPSTAHLKSKNLLVRYNSDNDTDDISDSSPIKMLDNKPTIQKLILNKVSVHGPALPNLSSASLDKPGETSISWDTHVPSDEVSQDVINEVCGGEACGWCLKHPGALVLQLCSACTVVAYCGAQCQGDSWPTHKKVCKKLKGASWMVKVELVREMTTLAKKRFLKRKLQSQCGSDEGDLLKNKKIKRTVQFNSQPQFEPSLEKGKLEKETFQLDINQPKSILRKGPIKLQTVLHSPPVKSLEQHLKIIKVGTQEERFQLVTGQAVQSGTCRSALKRQASEKLRRKLNEMKKVKSNLKEKCENLDISSEDNKHPLTVQSSPSSKLLCITPVSSPTLVEEIKTLSSSRKHSNRIMSRCFNLDVTAFPQMVDLGNDEELNLTPTVSEDIDELSTLPVNMPRKLDFDCNEGGEDEVYFKRSQLLSKISKDDNISSVASQDLFESPDPEPFNKTLDIPNANLDEPVPDKKSDLESCPADEYVNIGADGVESNHVVVESSNREERKKILAMIPESSSESSSVELSPMSVDLFSQSQVKCTDKLADLFSDSEGDQVVDDNNQDDDLLAII